MLGEPEGEMAATLAFHQVFGVLDLSQEVYCNIAIFFRISTDGSLG